MLKNGRYSLRLYDTMFWLKVYPRGDCWEWRGQRTAKGYGFIANGREQNIRAHRYAFTLAKGSIPDGAVIDHVCNHRWCMRPSHMVATAQEVNTMRGNAPPAKNARKVRCQRGHLFDVPNTILAKDGHRTCRQCKRQRRRERRAAARAA